MKNFKKIIAICLTLILMASCFCGCSLFSGKKASAVEQLNSIRKMDKTTESNLLDISLQYKTTNADGTTVNNGDPLNIQFAFDTKSSQSNELSSADIYMSINSGEKTKLTTVIMSKTKAYINVKELTNGLNVLYSALDVQLTSEPSNDYKEYIEIDLNKLLAQTANSATSTNSVIADSSSSFSSVLDETYNELGAGISTIIDTANIATKEDDNSVSVAITNDTLTVLCDTLTAYYSENKVAIIDALVAIVSAHPDIFGDGIKSLVVDNRAVFEENLTSMVNTWNGYDENQKKNVVTNNGEITYDLKLNVLYAETSGKITLDGVIKTGDYDITVKYSNDIKSTNDVEISVPNDFTPYSDIQTQLSNDINANLNGSATTITAVDSDQAFVDTYEAYLAEHPIV